MGRLSKKLVSIVTTVVVASTVMAQTPLSAIAANDNDNNLEVSDANDTVEETEASDMTVDEGVMLHAWNWSFKNIKDSLQEIKDAGYTAIQTSPAQACRLGANWDNADKSQTNDTPTWYYLYQPTYFTVGNDYLGTEAEFKEMCEEAHKLGLKIVVDVVANHLADVGTDHTDKVDQTLFSDARTMQNGGQRIEKWNEREQVTQGCCIGMPDINTKSEKSQNIIANYLKELVKDGADGFRFDAAKSIELPSAYENGKTSSDFWPNVLNAAKSEKDDGNLFVYGEVLQGDEPGTNQDGYVNSGLMRITASCYGQLIRYSVGYDVWQQEVNGKDVIRGEGYNQGKQESVTTPSVSKVITSIPAAAWDQKIPGNKLVGWVESHDLYANAGATRAMSVAQREVCWAILASRKEVVPLFFNRPVDTDFGKDMYNPKGEAYKPMGEKGSDDFKSKNVVAVNKFHNAMKDEDEKLSGLNNDSVYMASRGGKGVVLANVTTNEQNISAETDLKDGEYKNYGADGGTFTVKNGTLTGSLKGQSIAVLSTVDLSASETPEVKTPTISVKNGKDTLKKDSETSFDGSIKVTVNLKDAESATYKLGDAKEVELKDGDTITIDDTETLVITAKNGEKEATETYKFKKNPEVDKKDPKATAKLGGKAIEDNSTTTIEKETKLNVSFENVDSLSYKFNGEDVDLSDDEVKDAIENGLEIVIGKNLEAGETQKVEITVTNENGKQNYTYKFKMKDEEVVADPAEIIAKYNGNVVDENETIEFTDEAQLNLTFKNAASVTIQKDDNAPTSLNKNVIAKGKTVYVGADSNVGDTNTVVVKAKNSDGEEVTKTYTFKKVSEVKPPVEEEFKFNSATPDKTKVTLGSDVTITCDATGKDIKYALYTKKDDNDEEQYSAFQSSNKLTWTPEEEGNYVLRVVAKSGEEEQEQTIKVTVKTEEVKKDFSVKLTSEKETIELGDSVKLIANASDAQGTPKFKFKYKLASNSWTDKEVYVVAKGYSENNTIEWTPKKAGTYNVILLAQDDEYNDNNEDANKKYITSKEITITVTEKKDPEQKPSEDKPATSTTTTPEKPDSPTADTTKALPIVAMMVASAAALVKKFKRQ